MGSWVVATQPHPYKVEGLELEGSVDDAKLVTGSSAGVCKD